MPDIEEVYQVYRDRELVVIGVDIREGEPEVKRYVERGRFSWIFLLDSQGEVTGQYSIAAIPTSFFLDREGIVRSVVIGGMTIERMVEQIKPLLDK